MVPLMTRPVPSVVPAMVAAAIMEAITPPVPITVGDSGGRHGN
jgi:hypothetical protein